MPELTILKFVRETLGCTCPREVFEHIEDGWHGAVGAGDRYRRLLVGNRLLIYILDGMDMFSEEGAFEARLSALLAAGCDERDRLGLNRFRAVLPASDPARLAPRAQRILDAFRRRGGPLARPDEKVHLHVIAADACPAEPARDG